VKWFPKQKGLVSGVAVAGFGFGAYIFKGETVGALGFIKQYDIMPFFVVHGLICMVGIIVGALMLCNPPRRQRPRRRPRIQAGRIHCVAPRSISYG